MDMSAEAVDKVTLSRYFCFRVFITLFKLKIYECGHQVCEYLSSVRHKFKVFAINYFGEFCLSCTFANAWYFSRGIIRSSKSVFILYVEIAWKYCDDAFLSLDKIEYEGEDSRAQRNKRVLQITKKRTVRKGFAVAECFEVKGRE